MGTGVTAFVSSPGRREDNTEFSKESAELDKELSLNFISLHLGKKKKKGRKCCGFMFLIYFHERTYSKIIH